MTPEEYIEARLDNQISFYDKSSQSSQKHFKLLSAMQIVCGAVIPLVSGFSREIAYSEWIMALLGVTITCATAFLTLNKYQEKWINYRTTCETLQHLKHLYLTGSTPYQDDDSFNNFVNDVEVTISRENSDWSRYATKKSGAQK